jgi:hypothetical protein
MVFCTVRENMRSSLMILTLLEKNARATDFRLGAMLSVLFTYQVVTPKLSAALDKDLNTDGANRDR